MFAGVCAPVLILLQVPIDGMHDVIVPPPVSLFPRTIGWWVVLVLLAVLVSLVVLSWRRRVRARLYRRQALTRLDQLHSELSTRDPVAVASEIPVLVKQVALSAWPRARVASLHGDAWLEFLDSTVAGAEFSTGAGRLLPDLSYRQSVPDPSELEALFHLVRRWIESHHVRV